jgi:hypothetical protein
VRNECRDHFSSVFGYTNSLHTWQQILSKESCTECRFSLIWQGSTYVGFSLGKKQHRIREHGRRGDYFLLTKKRRYSPKLVAEKRMDDFLPTLQPCTKSIQSNFLSKFGMQHRIIVHDFLAKRRQHREPFQAAAGFPYLAAGQVFS